MDAMAWAEALEVKREKRKAVKIEIPTLASKRRKTAPKLSVAQLGKHLTDEEKLDFLDKCASMSMKEMLPIINGLVEERNKYHTWRIDVKRRLRRLEDEGMSSILEFVRKHTKWWIYY